MAKRMTAKRKIAKRPAAKKHNWEIQEFNISLGSVWEYREGALVQPDDKDEDNFDSHIRYHDKQPRLQVGCQEFDSKRDALEHWKDGLGEGGHPRPYAKSLVEYVDSVFKKLGIKW